MLAALGKAIASLVALSTLAAVLVGGAIALGLHQAQDDLASTIFTANATFVALILPAAALANTLLEGRLISYMGRLAQLDGDAQQRSAAAEALSGLANRVVEAVEPVLRGFMYLLLSFVLSILALFHPNHHIWTGAGWWKVRVEDLLLGGALGLDLLALLLFLPFLWVLLDRELAGQTRDVIRAHADKLKPTATTAVVADQAPVEPARAAEQEIRGRGLSGRPADGGVA